MYAFLDRPIISLSGSRHFLIVSARVWALAVAFRRCAFAALSPRFGRVALIETLPHFHRLMVALNAGGLRRMELGPPCRETIDEDEAMLLGLFDAGGQDEAALRRVAGALVGEGPELETLVQAVRRVVADARAAPALGCSR